MGELYRTEGRGRLYNSITETVGDTPSVRLNGLLPPTSPCTSRSNRSTRWPRLKIGWRSILSRLPRERAPAAGSNCGRGNLREYWDWSCHGLRRERVSPGYYHGRDLFCRAPATDENARAKVVLTPKEEKGTGMVQKPGNWRIKMAGFCAAIRNRGECGHSRKHHGSGDRR